MARWGLWTASAIGAGAGIALLRRRRSAATGVSGFDAEATAPAIGTEAPPAASPEDPRAALDAARERLRARADALRQQIERDEGDPGPG